MKWTRSSKICQHWDQRIQNMWFHNGALLCFLLGVCVMNIPQSHAKLTNNLWMSDGNSSGITDGDCYEDDSSRLFCHHSNFSATNTPEECKETCGSLGFNYAGVQMGNECWCGNVEPPSSRIRDSSECSAKCPGDDTLTCGGGYRMNIYKTVNSENGLLSRMAEAIEERLQNIPPKRDTTSELSKTLLKLDDLIQNLEQCSAQDIPQYNILEDLFLKIVEHPSLDDHFPDFASSFQNSILPTVIQSKNEDSPLLKSKLETPFPKPVDDSADPHEEMVTINGTYENCVFKQTPGEKCFPGYWVSTGLYAKQGQLIKVTVPSNIVGKFTIHIGAHTDRLNKNNQETWLDGKNLTRPCCITQYYHENVIKAETKLLSAYGGLIYINIPGSSQLGNFTLKFDKVITSPTFIQGKTTNEQWYKMLSSTKSPMAELEFPGIIITVLKEHFDEAHYNMDGLSSRLSQYMQAFFDMEGYVMPIPHRYAYDYAISAGDGHSGYPIMDDLAGPPTLYSTELLRLANGTDNDNQIGSDLSIFPHEVGHMLQNGMWNPPGFGETTNEIFGTYANEEVLNEHYLPEIKYIEEFKRNGRDLLNFSFYGKPTIFKFIKEECSWNTYKKFFKYYNEEIPESMVPKNDNETYSLMARVFSEKCNKNLIPFFKWWNWPILSHDEEATKNLAEWKGILDILENPNNKNCTLGETNSFLCNCNGVACTANYRCTQEGKCMKDGPDYLKEKDTDFTGTDIGSKKTDGEQECANIE